MKLTHEELKNLREEKPVSPEKHSHILLLKKKDSEIIFICKNNCPHRDKPLTNADWDGVNLLTCPFHGAVFNLDKKGAWVRGAFSQPVIVIQTCLLKDIETIELDLNQIK
jgi:nitrite reductase/ring-hydroxylating ferredoxin subunit